MRKARTILCAVLSASVFANCTTNYEWRNDNLIERVNSQIKSGDYERLYEEFSQSAKNYKYSKEEFVVRAKIVTERMREVDDSLSIQKDKDRAIDTFWDHPSRIAYRYIGSEGKRLGIDIHIDSNTLSDGKALLDFCVYTEKDDLNENPSNNGFCISDASKS
jgi:hypothetical protein